MSCRLSAISLALALLAAPIASAADLTGLRLVEDGQGTRAQLELDSLAAYKVFTLANPDRLVVDLDGARLAPGLHLPGPNGLVGAVRAGRPTPGTLRLVFDLGGPVHSESRVEREDGSTRLTVMLARPGQAPVADAPPLPVQPLPESAAPEVRIDVAPPTIESFATRAVEGPPAPSRAEPLPTYSPRTYAPVTAAPRTPEARTNEPARAGRTMRDVIGSGQRKLVVAIDAGHGGKDPGAHGPSGVREKNVTLAVARELARQVNADPGMRAVLIRDGDVFVPLKQRYMKARAAQADLFISIHADASPNDSATGASVFVLSTRGASSQAARWLADQENAADLVGGVTLDQKDPNLAAVLLDLSQSATMRASDDLANSVLGSLKNVGKAHKPAIERANFVVLRSPDVPSMLVETGFITNSGEEKRLNDPGYRSRLAAAITGGVRKYFAEQAPPGTWYAARRGGSSSEGGDELVAASPE